MPQFALNGLIGVPSRSIQVLYSSISRAFVGPVCKKSFDSNGWPVFLPAPSVMNTAIKTHIVQCASHSFGVSRAWRMSGAAGNREVII